DSSPGLYFTSASRVGKVDAATGAERWSKPETNSSGLLLLKDGALFVADNGISAYQASDGTLLWNNPLQYAYPDRAANGILYVTVFDPNDPYNSGAGGEQGVMYALDAKTGKTLWHVRHGTVGTVVDNTAYVTYLPDNADSISLAALNTA